VGLDSTTAASPRSSARIASRPLTMLFALLPFLESLVGAGAFLVAPAPYSPHRGDA
jgi:hypothetical protein